MKQTSFLTEKQAAERLGLSPLTLARWRWASKGSKFHKFEGAVRYSDADLADYVEAAR